MQKDQPSRTALKVAVGIVMLGEKPEMGAILPPGIVSATEELLLASQAISQKNLERSKSPRMAAVYDAFDWMLPGQFEAFAHRKAFCEGWVRKAIQSGATQVLVLGAGYDTLGWRLAAEYQDVRFFEIDHPATAALKAKGISAMKQRDNLFLIAQDLGSRRLIDTLKTVEFWDPNVKSVVIAEGLVMYLMPSAVRDLFCQLAEVTGDDSLIAFTFIASGEDGRPDVGRWTSLMLFLQKLAGEPWTWSIPYNELDHFLKEIGWSGESNLIGNPIKHGVEYFAAAIKQGPSASGNA